MESKDGRRRATDGSATDGSKDGGKTSKASGFEEIVTTDLLGRAIKFCSSPDFVDPVSSFEQQYAHLFRDLSDSKAPEEEEQSLEFTTLFNKFQALVEGLLEGFAAKNGSTVSSLFYNFRDTLEGRFLPLFQEEHENKWFCDIALSWLEYQSFIVRMCNAARLPPSSASSYDSRLDSFDEDAKADRK